MLFSFASKIETLQRALHVLPRLQAQGGKQDRDIVLMKPMILTLQWGY